MMFPNDCIQEPNHPLIVIFACFIIKSYDNQPLNTISLFNPLVYPLIMLLCRQVWSEFYRCLHVCCHSTFNIRLAMASYTTNWLLEEIYLANATSWNLTNGPINMFRSHDYSINHNYICALLLVNHHSPY